MMRQAAVLLHGMGRSWISMALLGHRLERRGYEVHLFGYRPRRLTLDALTAELRDFVKRRVEAEVYHFIGHSLGNIIVRNGLREGFRPGLSRIVMLAPPNRPARLASRLRENSFYRWRTGDSGQKLSDDEFYRRLPVPAVEFGVIAGDLGHHIGFDEPNDGVVSVECTKLEGMKDFALLHHTHTLIMMAADTAELCRRFLEGGTFSDLDGSGPA
ncbi:MAG: esterase/lipase family protein [Vicinamibacteria bacterium]